MKNLYFATFENVCTEIAIFETEAERNDWVNFRDWHSIHTKTNKDNCPLCRVALTESEARDMAGDLLDRSELFTEDAILENVRWLEIA